MATPAIPLKEFDLEMASTRKLLERVPGDKAAWKPHDKSFSLGHLAQLVSWMPGWIATSLRAAHRSREGEWIQPRTTDVLLKTFDANVRDARTALETVTDAALNETWSLKHGHRVLFTSPRGEVIRQHLNHLIRHRGQLTVYLRLVNVPLPSVYGPTADERF